MELKGKKTKVIIVGGVAGGASCAARLRRLDENAEIIMVERGPYVSYANCGLPYHISGVIEKESSLLVASEQMFRGLFEIDVRTNCEAVSISPKKKTVDLRDVATGKVTTETYDKLVLSPGAPSVRPPLPGIDLPGIFQVRTVPDVRTIREWIEKGTLFLAGMYNYSGIQFIKPARRAVVIGGGFIGLETAENLIHAGFEVTLVEMLDHRQHPQPLVEHGLEPAARIAARNELFEVHPDAEVLFAGRGEYHGPHARIGADCHDRLLKRVHELEGHPVSRRVLIFEYHDVIALLDAQGSVRHG